MPTIGTSSSSSSGPAPTTSGSYNSERTLYLPTSTCLDLWRASRARSANGGGASYVYFAGDSNTIAFGTNPMVALENTYGMKLRSLLAAREAQPLTSTIGPIVGPAVDYYTSLYPQVAPSGWYGGSAAAGGAAYPFGAQFCSAVRLTLKATGGMTSMTYSWNGGSTQTLTLTNTSTMATYTLTAPSRGSNQLTIQPAASGGGSLGIYGYEPIDSQYPNATKVTIDGIAGTTAGDWNTTWLNRIDAVAPNLAVVWLGINDLNQGVSVATYKANMIAYLAHVRSLSCDPIIISPMPGNYMAAGSSLAPYAAALYEVADTANVAYIDLSRRWPTYTSPQDYSANGVHILTKGHSDLAQAVYDAAFSFY